MKPMAREVEFDIWPPPPRPLSPAAKKARADSLTDAPMTWQQVAMIVVIVGLALALMAVGFFFGIWWNVAN